MSIHSLRHSKMGPSKLGRSKLGRSLLGRSSLAKTLLLALAATFALTCGTAQAEDSKAKPIAIVAFNSLDNLFQDANFLGGLAGQGNLSAQYQPMLKGFTPGLDHTKPIGLIVQSDGITPSGALCLPVTDLKQLLAVLKNFGVLSEDTGNGTFEISANGSTLIARESNGWAFLSMPGMLEDLPDNPGELFAALTKDYDLGVRLHVQNIPEAFRQMALSQVQMGMEAGMKKLDTESDEQYEARKAMTKVQVDQIKQAAQDLDELTFGLAIDGEQQRTFIDIVYTAVAGSNLAEKIAINSNPKTDFAGFFQPDAAMMMTFASKIGESDIAQIEQMFGAISKQIDTAIEEEADTESEEDKELLKSAVNDFLQSFKATLQAGKMDGGAVLNISSNSLSLVAGGFNADPAKVESGLKKLVEIAKHEEEKFPGVNWNSASHADVQFHTLSLPIPADEETAHELFGETLDMAVGIGKETAYFALGRDCLKAIQGIMDTSAASPQKSVPPMEMTFALAQIMETIATFADEDDKAQIEMIANMLSNEANGRDHVRIVVQSIPNGARTRIEAEEGVLRAFGMAAKAAQEKKMQAAGAGGF
ncbi:MAG: hypothetical protein GXP24_03715 [Planctomycetes bacterium]|nr:hypothetical protein [Planctomycetota bacterium]